MKHSPRWYFFRQKQTRAMGFLFGASIAWLLSACGGHEMPRWSKEELIKRTFPTVVPVSPDAMPLANQLLNFLQQLPTKPSQCVLVGQHIGSVPEQNNFSQKYVDGLFQLSGQRPALIGGDYLDWDGKKDRLDQMNQTLLNHWKDGALVTLSWHADNPWNGEPFNHREIGEFGDILKEGTDVYTRWQAELERIATGLQQLQDAGVVVLWRPFHEMNGGWFWWGQRDPALFVALWKQMFDFFTRQKKLKNLLWVYSPNAELNAWIDPVKKFYPGDAHVDVVALDVYSNHAMMPGYRELVDIGKPFGVAEFGPEPSKRDGSFDNRILMDAIRAHYPETRFFLFWNGWEEEHLAIVENQFAKELMDDPWSLARSMLPLR